MAELYFVSEELVRNIHQDVLGKGELDGEIEGRLASTLGAVESAFYYEQYDDAVSLAAWYAHALARGHCFTDGNKRTALQVLDFILIGHGFEMDLPQEDIAEIIEWVADGSLSREDLIEYLAAVVGEQSRDTDLTVP